MDAEEQEYLHVMDERIRWKSLNGGEALHVDGSHTGLRIERVAKSADTHDVIQSPMYGSKSGYNMRVARCATKEEARAFALALFKLERNSTRRSI